uniref:Envelope polyprotein n=1 Tax=Monopterus albus TaxID=43700 RepID=A0A3Q3PZ85_MONAL
MAAKVAYSQKSQQHKECYVCSLLSTNSIEGCPLMGAPITACDLCKLMNTATNSECQNMTLVQEPEWSDLGCQQVNKSVTCPSPPRITAFFRVVGQAMWCVEGTGDDTSPFLGNLECPPPTQDYFEEKSCANNQNRQTWLQSILTKTSVKVPKNMRWSCGSIGFSYLPPLRQWRGKCSLFYITPAMRVTKYLPSIERFEQHLTAVGAKRAKRDVEAKYAWDHSNDPYFTHHQTSVSRFFGALLPSYGVMQALDQIRDLSNITYELANRTTTSISLMQQQLGETTKMTLQNRMAMDQMLAAQGGVCKITGPECCTYIPDNSVSVEKQQEAIWQLAWKAKPEPLSSGPFSWLRTLFNDWGQEIVEGIVAVLLLFVFGFILFQCCIMCVKLCMNKITTGFTTNIMINQRVEEPEEEGSVYEAIPQLYEVPTQLESTKV